MASQLQTSDASEGNEAPSGVPPASRPAPAERSRRAHLSLRASAHLDWIRGLAAAAVMLSHVRGLFFLDYPELSRKSPALSALYALTGLGHQAVMVFFVLSGFFISTSVVFALRERRWSWRAYLINRVSRLELVLLPALLLGALWDQIGLRLPSGFALYHSGLYKFYLPSVALRSTVSGFFGNLFFLQSIRFQVFGSNGPLWSLTTSSGITCFSRLWSWPFFRVVPRSAASKHHPRGRRGRFCGTPNLPVFPDLVGRRCRRSFSARSSAPHSETVLAHCHLNERAFCGHARS